MFSSPPCQDVMKLALSGLERLLCVEDLAIIAIEVYFIFSSTCSSSPTLPFSPIPRALPLHFSLPYFSVRQVLLRNFQIYSWMGRKHSIYG